MWQWVREEAHGQYNEINVAQMIVAALFGSVHSAGMVSVLTFDDTHDADARARLLRIACTPWHFDQSTLNLCERK